MRVCEAPSRIVSKIRLVRDVSNSCGDVAESLAVWASSTARSVPFGWTTLMARAKVALAPALLSEPRICALTVPEMVWAKSGPMTVRPMARAVGLVVPVASVLEVIADPSFWTRVPGTVTGLI